MRYRCLLLTAALALAVPAAAPAQFAYTPSNNSGFSQTQGVAGAPAGGAPFAYSPWGYGYPATWGYGNSVGGFLNGSASVMSAAGQYEISHQQANLGREQVKSAHIDNKRKMFDELRYEQENTPPLSANLEKSRQEQVRQMMNPQLPEIWSATAPNVLLTDIQQIQLRTGLQGATIPLEEEVVKHLSLTTGTMPGSSGLLKDGGKLHWPPELQDDRFKADCEAVDKLLPQMIEQAKTSDGVSGKSIREMERLTNSLVEKVTAAVDDMTPSDNIRAMKYVQELTASTKLLRSPDIAKTLGGAWQAQGNTVGELVAFMTSKGLKFAPASRGEEPYYTSLHRSLVAYDSSLQGLMLSPGSRPELRSGPVGGAAAPGLPR
jgi:hypothetical protein